MEVELGVLDRLWELQKVLSELTENERLLTDKPESFAGIDERYQDAKTSMSRLEEKLTALNLERRKIDGDLQAEQETLKKYQGQLMQVKNQQQYSAAWKEIDASKKKIKELEDAELSKMGEIDETQAQLDALREQNGALTAEWEVAHGEWQASLSSVREQVDAIKARVKNLEADLPAGPLRQFNRILEQRHGIGVALVEGEACSICRFKVRSQALIDIKRGEMLTCEGCRRILYIEATSS
jgi:predicted  nucleic acid-binding Zn-ribbon protein